MSGRKHYRVCLVGAGRMGTRWAGIITANRSTRLALVVDPVRAAGKKLADRYGADYAASLAKRALDMHTIDAVFVVTPHAYLYPNAKRALASGRHVFVEKPGATRGGDVQALERIAKRQKCALMVGFNYRHFDGISRAKKLVESGVIGDIISMSIRHGHAGRAEYGKEWRMNKRLAGGGVLMDQGVHLLDLALSFLGGRITDVKGVLGNRYWKSPVEDNAVVTLKNAAGQLASVHVSVTAWKPIFIMEVVGTKGYCIVNGVGRKYGGGETLTIGRIKKNGTVSEKTTVCDSDPDRCLRAELKVFFEAMRNGRARAVNVESAIEVLNIVDKVYKSA